jgi:hypothetical protein
MDASGEDFEALPETAVFSLYFKETPDRWQAGKIAYPRDEILQLGLEHVLKIVARLFRFRHVPTY